MNTPLVILLTIVVLRPFFDVPNASKKGQALKIGGYKPSIHSTLVYFTIVPAGLILWWWYALSTDQILLGVIPTVGTLATIIAFSVEYAGAKK